MKPNQPLPKRPDIGNPYRMDYIEIDEKVNHSVHDLNEKTKKCKKNSERISEHCDWRSRNWSM